MATFITDRTQADVDTSLTLFNKVKSTAWASLSSAEQNAYLSTDTLYEDRGRFSIASAERISSYLRELTSQLLEESPPPIPTTIDGRSVGIWGSRNFKADPDYPSGTVKTVAVPSGVNFFSKVSNGNFVGTTGWSGNSATISAASNTLSFTATAIYGGAIQSVTLVVGHKYYAAATLNGPTNIYLNIRFPVAYKYKTTSSSERVSLSFTATNTSDYIEFRDNRSSGWTTATAQYAVLIDLTDIFGSGNEPTTAWMDAFLSSNFTNSFVTTTSVFPDVNTTTDVAYIMNHGLTVGQWYRVLYTTSDTTLGGLTNGDFYDVYIVDANTVAFLYGGIGTDITSKPASGTYTLNFITAPYFAVNRDDFQYWVDILTAKYGANPTGWTPINSPYLSFETLNILEQKTEAILSGSIATITETSGTYMTNDEMLIFDDYLGL